MVVDFDAEFEAFIPGKSQRRVGVFRMASGRQPMEGQGPAGSHEFPASGMKQGRVKTDRMVWGLHVDPGLYRAQVERHHPVPSYHDGVELSDDSPDISKGYRVRIEGGL